MFKYFHALILLVEYLVENHALVHSMHLEIYLADIHLWEMAHKQKHVDFIESLTSQILGTNYLHPWQIFDI